ncbi:MAG: ATPase [Gammaproteobacteria bacterium]|nr:MAG: ATPase [Gammaproteobacteria bacterium]
MGDCCNHNKPEPTPPPKHENAGGCCGPKPKQGEEGGSCHSDKGRPDYLLWVSGAIVLACYVLYWLVDGHPNLPRWMVEMSSGVYELINRMWWGLLAAVFFVGLLDRVPRELVMSALGKGGTVGGISRATLAGLMLDLCSHGILMVGAKLYERGASLGQLMAFLIASPWNSLSLTIILVALIGLGWTLAFIVLSMAIGIVTGLVFDRLVSKGVLPGNPHAVENGEPEQGFGHHMSEAFKSIRVSPKGLGSLLWDGLKGSQMVFRWLFFGVVLATAIRAFVPMDTYQTLFGPTVAGLLLTMVAATIIEVCSEGSTPIAADIVTRAAAPGNGFAFLMAGVATDYTEVMVIRDLTKSWKIALFLPLISLPQVLVVGWILNQLG